MGRFSSQGSEEPMKDFKQGSDMIRYTFQRDHSEGCLENGLEDSMNGGWETGNWFANPTVKLSQSLY